MDQIVNKKKSIARTSISDTLKQQIQPSPSREQVEEAIRTLLLWTGDNPQREGLKDTPARVAKAYTELFSGYKENPDTILDRTFEEVANYDSIIIMRDISFFSHCEHHMVPIIGKAHVAYLPDGRVLGLSKIARVIDIYAKRLQTQEGMTAQIAYKIQEVLKPRGVAVMLEAEHMCMAMRGIRKKGSTTLTTTFTGGFKDNRQEQLNFIAQLNRTSSPENEIK
ncbi:GTP cyclohydrolase I FolE [Candidatus Endowatersipora endosymbiont of Watersipora subatra]|uniref:GTP cyclohydrolase I FolE n=1 Tax=Candidatus Endowatersipora endosymbiont of Watersipora subatra TaxID=3077946 RepID=UPI00312C8CD0